MITLIIGVPLLLLGIAGMFVSGKPSGNTLDTEEGSRPYFNNRDDAA